MSDHVLPEQVCYVNCSFCNTTLLVNVPGSNSSNVVAVRCELCANLLSVNLLEALLGKLPLQNLQNHNTATRHHHMDCESSSICTSLSAMNSVDHVQQQMQLIRPTEKRRVPSAYNRFIKEEIRRLKTKNPNISHKEAFSTAAKNEIESGPLLGRVQLDELNGQMKKVLLDIEEEREKKPNPLLRLPTLLYNDKS